MCTRSIRRVCGNLTALKADLAGIALADDAATLKLKSRDFFWFSPILKPLLEDKRAELVAMPRTRDEVVRIAAACARYRVPLTVRGGGTGNYGQAVPLAGGVVLDMVGLDRVVSVTAGAGRFEAGARLLDIDRALRPERWELRFHPSTRKQATIGGFIAGGAAGCGSCTWGQIADPGAVLAVQVVTVEESPRVIELSGRDILKVLHAYGVNGIITEVAVPLAPWQPWAERILAFPTLGAAARFGWALAAAEGIAKKEIGIFDRRIPPMLKRVAPFVPEGEAMAVVMVAEAQGATLADLAADHGGRVVYERSAAEAEAAAFDGKGTLPPLYEYAWNHTTLHALKVEPAISYLRCAIRKAANSRSWTTSSGSSATSCSSTLRCSDGSAAFSSRGCRCSAIARRSGWPKSWPGSRSSAALCRARTLTSLTTPAGKRPTRRSRNSRRSPILTD